MIHVLASRCFERPACHLWMNYACTSTCSCSVARVAKAWTLAKCFPNPSRVIISLKIRPFLTNLSYSRFTFFFVTFSYPIVSMKKDQSRWKWEGKVASCRSLIQLCVYSNIITDNGLVYSNYLHLTPTSYHWNVWCLRQSLYCEWIDGRAIEKQLLS